MKNLNVISEISWIRIGKDADLVAESKYFFLSDSVSGLDFSENNMILVPVLLISVTVPVCIYIFNYYTVINFIQPVYNTIGADFWHEYSLKPKFFRN